MQGRQTPTSAGQPEASTSKHSQQAQHAQRAEEGDSGVQPVQSSSDQDTASIRAQTQRHPVSEAAAKILSRLKPQHGSKAQHGSSQRSPQDPHQQSPQDLQGHSAVPQGDAASVGESKVEARQHAQHTQQEQQQPSGTEEKRGEQQPQQSQHTQHAQQPTPAAELTATEQNALIHWAVRDALKGHRQGICAKFSVS